MTPINTGWLEVDYALMDGDVFKSNSGNFSMTTLR